MARVLPYSLYDERDWSRTIDIASDKPGRKVIVQIGGLADTHTPMVTLEVGGIFGQSEWTWLDLAEARKVADALGQAVDMAW